jgi:hypothetical protein
MATDDYFEELDKKLSDFKEEENKFEMRTIWSFYENVSKFLDEKEEKKMITMKIIFYNRVRSSKYTACFRSENLDTIYGLYKEHLEKEFPGKLQPTLEDIHKRVSR